MRVSRRVEYRGLELFVPIDRDTWAEPSGNPSDWVCDVNDCYTIGARPHGPHHLCSVHYAQLAPVAISVGQENDILHRFAYHEPTAGKAEQHDEVRMQLRIAALAIAKRTPVSREQALALTKLEEAMFWANAAISRETK